MVANLTCGFRCGAEPNVNELSQNILICIIAARRLCFHRCLYASQCVCQVGILENTGTDTRIRTTDTYMACTYGKDGQLNTDILECVCVFVCQHVNSKCSYQYISNVLIRKFVGLMDIVHGQID